MSNTISGNGFSTAMVPENSGTQSQDPPAGMESLTGGALSAEDQSVQDVFNKILERMIYNFYTKMIDNMKESFE